MEMEQVIAIGLVKFMTLLILKGQNIKFLLNYFPLPNLENQKYLSFCFCPYIFRHSKDVRGYFELYWVVSFLGSYNKWGLYRPKLQCRFLCQVLKEEDSFEQIKEFFNFYDFNLNNIKYFQKNLYYMKMRMFNICKAGAVGDDDDSDSQLIPSLVS